MSLFMHHTKCQIINAFQNWVSKFDWPTFIDKVESQYLGIWKMHIICKEALVMPKQAITIVLKEKKEEWINTKE